jgi:5-enolpyruvylshikimate-3-phosphate synthase
MTTTNHTDERPLEPLRDRLTQLGINLHDHSGNTR